MNLSQLTSVLTNAGAGALQTANQIAATAAQGIEAAIHARRQAVMVNGIQDGMYALTHPQRHGVMQEQSAFSLGYSPQLLDDAQQQMADELAAAAAGLITRGSA